MKEINLNHGYKTAIDDSKYDLTLGYTWRITGATKRTRYAVTNIHKDPSIGWTSGHRVLSMHRLVMGNPGPEWHVDHVDGDGLNNQLSNATGLQ